MKTNILVGITISMMLLCCTLPASASDYTLGIFGNANEDDTINMQDVTYTELIILEYRDRTELSDAKHDDKINMQDVTQIELVILGKEKELTLIDGADRIVTVNKPVKRVVTLTSYPAEVIRIFGTQDKIVGIGSGIAEDDVYFPELSKLPAVGSSFTPDLEAILTLNPDLVFTWNSKAQGLGEDLALVTVVGFDLYKPETIAEEVEKCGYIFGSRDEAGEFIDWYEGYMNAIEERTEGISEGDKPRIYFESPKKYKTGGGGTGWDRKIVIAGGNNIFSDLPAKSYLQVDPEEVAERNPEIVVKEVSGGSGYATDDPAEFSGVRGEIMSRAELTHVDAVEDEKVYIIHIDIFGGFDHLPGIAYFAKWFHPDLFEDMDPQAIHQEYLTEFQGLDYDLNEHGVFVYPLLEES